MTFQKQLGMENHPNLTDEVIFLRGVGSYHQPEYK